MGRRVFPTIDAVRVARLLDRLASVGIRLRDGVTADDVVTALAADWRNLPSLPPTPEDQWFLDLIAGYEDPGTRIEDPGTRLLERRKTPVSVARVLCELGNERWTRESGPRPALSVDVAHIDAECIGRDGSYVAIVERFAELASGVRLYDAVRDHVDIDGGVARVEFEDAGMVRTVELTVHNDWLDERIIDVLAERLAGLSDRRFAIHEFGQDFLVVCRTPKDIDALNQMTGLSFRIVG